VAIVEIALGNLGAVMCRLLRTLRTRKRPTRYFGTEESAVGKLLKLKIYTLPPTPPSYLILEQPGKANAVENDYGEGRLLVTIRCSHFLDGKTRLVYNDHEMTIHDLMREVRDPKEKNAVISIIEKQTGLKPGDEFRG
jgi:hypothetical protein